MSQVRIAISGTHGSGKSYITGKLKEHFEGLGVKVAVVTSSTRALKALGVGINTDGTWEAQAFSGMNRAQRQLEAAQSDAQLVLGDRCVADELAYNNWHLVFGNSNRQVESTSLLLLDLLQKDIAQYWDVILWKRRHPDYPPVDDGDRLSSQLFQVQVDERFEKIYDKEEKVSLLPLDRDSAFEVARDMITQALIAKGVLASEAHEPQCDCPRPECVALNVTTERDEILGHDHVHPGSYNNPLPTVRDAIRLVLRENGEDPEREGLRDTPDRVARMYAEFFSGLTEDPSVHLKKQFTTDSASMVIVKDIAFTSLCEHHLLPFFGVAHIGYIPGKVEDDAPGTFKRYRVAGLSKFGRVVDGFSRRPQVQEQLTFQIARCIQSELQPQGVIVAINAEHSCMSLRGVKKSGAKTLTSAVTGIFDSNKDNVKGEFFSMLEISR